MSVSVNLGLYRHYKGNLYVVVGTALLESNPDKVQVVYQDVEGKRTWIRPYDDFFAELSPDIKNPTGQKYRFEKMSAQGTQISSVSTKVLLEELSKRPDNPYAGISVDEAQNSLVCESFVVGRRVEIIDPDTKELHIDIDADSVYNDLEGAKSRLFKLNDPRYTIFQKFFRTFDF